VEPSPLTRICNAYQERLRLNIDDRLLFDFLVSVITATLCKMLDEPVWAYLIGPPGSSKTESVKPFEPMDDCFFISSLTDNWLMSGHRDEDGNDPSLLKSMEGKIVVVKDMSSLMNLPPKTINKIWGDLRDAFDQSASKASGVSGLTKYDARFGVLMLGTEAIDVFAEEHQQLGERFLAFRIHRVPLKLEERQELAMHVHKTMDNKKKWRSDLVCVVGTEMNHIKGYINSLKQPPQISEETAYEIMMMANLLSLLRTSPVRGVAESSELPTRVGQQLINLGSAHAIADGRDSWNENDLQLIRRVTIDTLPGFRARIIGVLYERGPYRPMTSILQIMQKCEISKKEIIFNILTQYLFSSVVETDETGENFRLTDKIYRAIKQVKILEKGKTDESKKAK